MHTKEEIAKKRGKSSGQPDLASPDSAKDLLKHKRRWIYFALFITTGLSLFFWLYRSFKTLRFPPPLPRLTLDLSRPVSGRLALSSELSALLSSHQDITGFYLSHDHPSSNVSYGSVSGLNFDSLKATLVSLPKTAAIPNAALLPEGIDYREKIEDSAGRITLTSLITNPIDRIFIIVRFNGSPDSLKSLAPALISAAYWTVSAN
jgi:hypothetical protein